VHPGRQAALALAIGLAVSLHDPSAPAALAKGVLLCIVGVATLALALPAIVRGDRSISASGACWLLLVGWLAASLWRSPGADALLPWVGASALMLGVDDAEVVAGRAAAVILASAGVSTCIAFAAGARGVALHGGMGNPNWLGIVIAVALPLALDRLGPAGRIERACVAVSACASLPALVLAQSYVAWVGLGAAALIVLRGRWRLAALAPLCALLLGHVSGELSASLAGRVWIWRASADAAMARPLLGHGLGGFTTAFFDAQGARLAPMELDAASVAFVNARSAHGDWLQLAVEGGLAAPLSFAACIALAARGHWRAGQAALLVIAIAAIADAPLQLPAVVALLALVLAASPPLSPRRADGALALAVLAMCALLLPRGATSWIAARRIAQDAPPTLRVAHTARAAEGAPHDGSAAFAHGLALLEVGQAARALEELRRAEPLHADVALRIALGNAALAAGEDPVPHYRRALEWHPASFRAHLNLAEAYRRRGDLEHADEHLTDARQLWPHHPKLLLISEQLRRDRLEAATR
jgi:tetratricopeptide (TPR) repeat protein